MFRDLNPFHFHPLYTEAWRGILRCSTLERGLVFWLVQIVQFESLRSQINHSSITEMRTPICRFTVSEARCRILLDAVPLALQERVSRKYSPFTPDWVGPYWELLWDATMSRQLHLLMLGGATSTIGDAAVAFSRHTVHKYELILAISEGVAQQQVVRSVLAIHTMMLARLQVCMSFVKRGLK